MKFYLYEYIEFKINVKIIIIKQEIMETIWGRKIK